MKNKEKHLHFTISEKAERYYFSLFDENNNVFITNYNKSLMKIHFEKFHYIMYV